MGKFLPDGRFQLTVNEVTKLKELEEFEKAYYKKQFREEDTQVSEAKES